MPHILFTAVTYAAAVSIAIAAGLPNVLQPTVTIKNGTVVGTSSGGVEKFLGIPYALPPVKDRRLRQPAAITTTFGSLMATATPSYCPQFNASTSAGSSPASATDLPSINSNGTSVAALLVNLVQPASQSEDCLYLSVHRPSGVKYLSDVPVVVWIHGGAFQIGGSGTYNADALFTKAGLLGEPFVFVAINYRLSSFGFLPGEELSRENNTNLGLRDQRAALHWVAENIRAFGGDPDKVTIWGESAGSWSVTDHTLIDGGDNSYLGKALFRGAIQNSGAIYPAQDVRSDKARAVFDGFVQRAGCGNADDKLACLREIPYEQYAAAQNSILLTGGSINFPYIVRPDPASRFFATSPEVAIADGQFARVPVLAFNQQDEGTLFGFNNPGPYETERELLDFWKPVFTRAANQTLSCLFDLYPATGMARSPYNTGFADEIYPGYKRISAMIGDVLFIHMRRIYLDTIACKVNVWSGLATYNQGTPVFGTTHATDVFATFFGLAPAVATDEILTRWISFINHNDPNTIGQRTGSGNYTVWPRYNTATRLLLSLDANRTSMLTDDFRYLSYKYLKAHIAEFRI